MRRIEINIEDLLDMIPIEEAIKYYGISSILSEIGLNQIADYAVEQLGMIYPEGVN
jgi:hypothetical protein